MKTKDAYGDALAAIDARVTAAVRAAGYRICHVDYSAYPVRGKGDDEAPRDNLDRVAARGKVILCRRADDFFGGRGSRGYQSSVLDSPTWLEVCVHAEAGIRATRDRHHVFLEGLDRVRKEGGVTVYEMVMGS